MIPNKRKADTKKAQTKAFVGKWFYFIIGSIFGFLFSVIISVEKVLFIIFKTLNISVSILKNIHDYINESTLLTALIVPLILTILTSYFKEYFKEKFSKK